MNDNKTKKNHTVTLENREKLALDGINEVPLFNDEEIKAYSDWGIITVKGENLHIKTLELDTGILEVTGQITAVIYSDSVLKKGALRGLFS